MLPFLDRYSRQRKLLQVGRAGQARIEALRVELKSCPGTLVELAYLERAGVGCVEISSLPNTPLDPPPPFPHASAFQNPKARAVAAGAWRALQTLKAALEPEPEVGTASRRAQG